MSPATQYADSAGCSVAFQVVGQGPVDVIFVPGLMSHLDLQWSDPQVAGFLREIATGVRLIVMDQRGVGLSDRADTVATVEVRSSDIAAVLDAAGAAQPIVIGHCHGGPPAAVFAAMYPERVSGLILMSTFARGIPDGRPGALPEGTLAIWETATEDWGRGHSLRLFAPSRHEGGLYRRLYASFERSALTPGMARAAVASTREIDISGVLQSVAAPTLVIHCAEDFIPVTSAEYLASLIPDARLTVFPGSDHVPFAGTASPEIASTINEFIALHRHPAKAVAGSHFAAMLMIDIVDSTSTVVRVGDSAWLSLLRDHDAAVREEIDRHHGECTKFTGDGYLAIFRQCESALECAQALTRIAARFGFVTRCGVNAGDYQPFGDDAIGMPVIVAARLMDRAQPGTALVAESVMTAVAGAGYRFGQRETLVLKGVPFSVSAARLETDTAPPTGTWRTVAWGSHQDRRSADRLVVAVARRFPGLVRRAASMPLRQFMSGTMADRSVG